MVLTAHQPVYLPWLGLFHKISLADRFVSFDRVQYLPKDWNNRNRVKTANGPIWLSVPVHKHGHRDKPLAEIEIDNRTPWQRKHLRSLEHGYAKAPHFGEYRDFFEDVYSREWTHLAALDDHMLRWFLDTLGIDVAFERASDHDFRGAKSELVLDMCRTLGAERYVFGAHGRDYADVDAFAAAGIEVVFQDYRHPVYPQLHGDFEPYLSIVDLLFNCGDASLEILLGGQPEP
jgi:WbqC-like protein family